jgi:spermidine/putrescine transport system substrate-binding protein
MAAMLAACQTDMAEAPILNLYSWPDYENPDTLTGFTHATGISVYTAIFESNEEMVENVLNHPGDYDVVVPSSDTVSRMIKDQLLMKLDQRQLPNFNNLSEQFRSGRAYDPMSDYSIVKTWGTTGILWRPDVVTNRFTRWADFWAAAPKYAGQIIMIDSRDEIIGIALKHLGYSINDGEVAHLNEARAKLMELKPHVVVTSDYIEKVEAHTVSLVVGWNGDAAQIRADGTPIEYAIPEDGSVLWTDNWCLPASALHPNNAHAFINYLLDPQVAAIESTYIGYATVVEDAIPLLDPALQNDPLIYPPESTLALQRSSRPAG